MEVHTQMRNNLRNSKIIRDIRNHPSIYTTLIISVLNVMVGKQIHASDVDQRIILSKNAQNRTLRIRKFTGIWEGLKLVVTYQQKYIRYGKTVQIKSSHIRYTRLWHVCLTMHKSLEEILVTY